MSREDIARLLGGYATGTLTPEEQQALFAAALEDQELFDELAREQALRDVLREPAARAQLLAALEDRLPWYRRFGSWRVSDGMPSPATLAALAACLLVVGALAIWRPWHQNELPQPSAVATELPAEAPATPAAPAAVEQKGAAIPSTTPAKARTLLPPPLLPRAIELQAAPPMKKELLAADAASSAEPRQADLPAAAAPPPVNPATPQKPQIANQTAAADTILAGRDSGERMKIVPGPGAAGALQSAGAAAGTTAAISAFSTNGTQPSGAIAIPPGGARQLFYAGSAVAAQKEATESKRFNAAVRALGSQAALGIKWSILRLVPGGEYAIVNAEDLRAGDTVKLRFASNQSCDLSVFDNASALVPLFTGHVQAGESLDSPPLSPWRKGLRQLAVLLARGGVTAGTLTRMPQAQSQAQQSETDRGEQATYTVGPADTPQVSLLITLNYQ